MHKAYHIQKYLCVKKGQLSKNNLRKIAITFLSFSLNMCFGCSKEPSIRDGSFEYPQHMFCLRNKKNIFQLRTLIWRPAFSLRKYNEPQHDKTNKISVHPVKTQVSLGILPVWSESSLCAEWLTMGPSFLRADSEDSGDLVRLS